MSDSSHGISHRPFTIYISLLHYLDVNKLASNLKQAVPFQSPPAAFQPPPAEPVRPSGSEIYRGVNKPSAQPSPAPYQPPLPPYQTHQQSPSSKPSGLDPKDFMPVCI